MGLQQYKRTQWHDDALLFRIGAFVNICKMGLQQYKRTRWHQTPKSPIENAHTGRKRRLNASTINLESRISGTGWHDDAEHGIPDFISFMRARHPVFWPKKGIKNRGFRALWRCVALFFGLVRLYRGKIFARWVYNNTNARDDTTMRCFVFRIGAFV